MNRTARLAAPILSAAILASQPGWAQDETPDPEQARIESIVRDYLIREPEVLLEALDALETKRAEEATLAQREAIEAAGAELASTPEGTALGNPDGDVTIVEFFDYNCGFCKRAHEDMGALIEADPELRIVLKEIPVLGPPSEAASRVSLAVRATEPERYGQFYKELLLGPDIADETTALRIVGEMGLDEAAIREAMDGPGVQSTLQDNARLATLLQINGTPSYVIGDILVPGAVGAEVLAGHVANMRECGEPTC